MTRQLIECVPNFSEGRDMNTIKIITDAIERVEGVRLLDVDPGKATNRTVVTFVGEPNSVVEAAFQAIKIASQVIDMEQHTGEHPRMGATDVCPLVPVSNITMEEVAAFAHQLGKRVGEELSIPIYMYESAATKQEWKNLATVRAGEYEALPEKMKQQEWKPDYGSSVFNAKAGATAIGARDFLVAYNVNLNTTSVRRANSVAFDIREKGRVKRKGNPISGPIVRDVNGEPLRVAGTCKSVKAIGWYIEEYGLSQISMNLTNIRDTPLHMAFEECRKSANSRGMRVTGSELVGLVPLQVMLDAGKYFLKQQERSVGISEKEIIHIAVKSMGLDELSDFDPQIKIIEYQLSGDQDNPLVNMDLREFSDVTASESPAPGGGSVAAYIGALGISLGTMVANLSAHKRGWDDRWEQFSEWAEKGQAIKDGLIALVDEDTRAFNAILSAIRMSKNTTEEKYIRSQAIQNATKVAIDVPFKVLELCHGCFALLEEMAGKGNPNSASDAGVGALCVRAAARGAFLNVKTNAVDLEDKEFVTNVLQKGESLLIEIKQKEEQIIQMVNDKINE